MKTSAYLYTAEQIRDIEADFIRHQGIESYELMLRAASAAFNYVNTIEEPCRSILLLCGPGNNGGDGYALASLLSRAWSQLTVMSVCDPADLADDAAKARDDWVASGGKIQRFSGNLPKSDLILDCVLGTGVSRPLSGDYLAVVNAMNAANGRVIAIDIPTGLDSDKGVAVPVATKADTTITFVGYKQGQFIANGPDYCGELILDQLGIEPEPLLSKTPARTPAKTGSIKLTSLRHCVANISARKLNTHKGNFGHVVIIGGSPGTQGAVRLAAEAALRSGAGMVSVVTHPDHHAIVCASTPEIMCHGASTVEEVRPLLQKASAIVVGPGLDTGEWAQQWLPACSEICGATKKPLVVDAGALRHMALANELHMPSTWVLTPHPGEAAALLEIDTSSVQQDRVAAIAALQSTYGGVVVLKGSGSLVTDGENTSLCKYGNPGMATAGMGDVLSGIIAAILMQMPNIMTAAETAVIVHAVAGDKAAGSKPVGLIASDLFPHIRNLINPVEPGLVK